MPLIARGLFPPFVPLGSSARGLPEADLDLWLAYCLCLRSGMEFLRDPVVLLAWPQQIVDTPCSGIRLLRMPQVLARIGVGKSQLYRMVNAGVFPWPAPVGQLARRWAEHEVEEWLRACRLQRSRALKAANPWVCARPGSESGISPPQ